VLLTELEPDTDPDTDPDAAWTSPRVLVLGLGNPLLGALPSPLVVAGIEPESTDDLYVGLTPTVEAAIEKAVAEGVRVLRTLAED